MSNVTASSTIDPTAPQTSMSATPSWLWTVVGVIVLVALAGGGIAGFEYGRQYERENGAGHGAHAFDEAAMVVEACALNLLGQGLAQLRQIG